MERIEERKAKINANLEKKLIKIAERKKPINKNIRSNEMERIEERKAKINANLEKKLIKIAERKKPIYVDFLNCKKGYQLDRKYFATEQEAKKWCLKTMDNFDIDMIKIV